MGCSCCLSEETNTNNKTKSKKNKFGKDLKISNKKKYKNGSDKFKII